MVTRRSQLSKELRAVSPQRRNALGVLSREGRSQPVKGREVEDEGKTEVPDHIRARGLGQGLWICCRDNRKPQLVSGRDWSRTLSLSLPSLVQGFLLHFAPHLM